jgi:hypothetical protein
MERTPCYAYLNARIMPVERGNFFEIPLDALLAKHGVGEVTGGGTLQDQHGEIVHCGIDIDLELTQSNLNNVCGFLEHRGAPKGSKFKFEHNGIKEEIPFGKMEGIGVYLNGTDLPEDVYKNSSIDMVMESFNKLISNICVIRGYWQGKRETALYLYGPSAADLQSRLSGFIAEYPLCQKARIVQIA